MKKHLLTLCLFIISNFLYAQDVAFIPSNYIGGYNVSCNGATDGTLQAILNGDGAPYTYQWSNGSYSSTITNIGAGVYTLTVTNTFGAQITNSFEMIQPNPLSAVAYVSDYNGSNVSQNGASDGDITLEPIGGGAAGSCTYLWSNGATERRIIDLQAGTYSVTITDPNQCTFTLSRTLIEPQLLQITGVLKSNFNGFNTTCFTFEDGWAEVTAIGGTTPYTYRWSNGSFNQRAEGLKVGNYAVEVVDANNIKAIANITITQPDKLEPNLNVTTFSNGYNISCFNCSNGAASLAITGGVNPFNIVWSTGSNANSISGLNMGNYNLNVTDANGCSVNRDFNVTQPDREDWSMNGNTNSNPATQYMGTADSTDFVIKTNSVERLRINGNGNLNSLKLAGNGDDLLITDSVGNISRQSRVAALSPWLLNGNSITNVNNFIGTTTNYDLKFKTNSLLRMIIEKTGDVGIGTNHPDAKLEVAHNTVSGSAGGLILRNISTDNFNSEIKFNSLLNELWAIGCDFEHNKEKNFFIYDNSINQPYGKLRFLIDKEGRVGINMVPPTTSTLYKLYVEGGVACRDVLVTTNSPFPDYVFDKEYKLMSIYELDKYIQKNKHLPEVKSAEEVKKANGIVIGEMQIALLKKIEEQTLYIISLQKQIDEIKTKIK